MEVGTGNTYESDGSKTPKQSSKSVPRTGQLIQVVLDLKS